MKAKESLEKALALGDTTMAAQAGVCDELTKYEVFAKAALKKKDYREATYYATKLVESCPDSISHMKLRIKTAILH